MEVLFTAARHPTLAIHAGDNPNLLRLGALISGHAGQTSRQSGKVQLQPDEKPRMTVAGPLTAETPIDFGGDLLVTGDLHEGAQVRVAGNVEITGSVYGGTVRAGGSVRVRRSIRHAHVEAIADIAADSAESATLHCEGDLTVRGDIKFCSSEVGGMARAGGRIFGGHLVADLGVRALALGNRSGLRTQVMVVPEARRQARKAQIQGELARDSARMAVCQGASGRINGLTGEGAISARLYLAECERRNAREAAEKLQELGAIEAHPINQSLQAIAVDQGIYPGVEIQINQATLPVDRLIPPGRFGERYGQIASLHEVNNSAG